MRRELLASYHQTRLETLLDSRCARQRTSLCGIPAMMPALGKAECRDSIFREAVSRLRYNLGVFDMVTRYIPFGKACFLMSSCGNHMCPCVEWVNSTL